MNTTDRRVPIALWPLVHDCRTLRARLLVADDTPEARHLVAQLSDAISAADDGARLNALATQARIALGDDTLPDTIPVRMMEPEEANMRELIATKPREIAVKRVVKPARTFQCTACMSEVPYTKFRCPDCGARVLTDPGVRALVLAARDAITATAGCGRWCNFCGHPEDVDIKPMPHTDTCWVPPLTAAVALAEGRAS